MSKDGTMFCIGQGSFPGNFNVGGGGGGGGWQSAAERGRPEACKGRALDPAIFHLGRH